MYSWCGSMHRCAVTKERLGLQETISDMCSGGSNIYIDAEMSLWVTGGCESEEETELSRSGWLVIMMRNAITFTMGNIRKCCHGMWVGIGS